MTSNRTSDTTAEEVDDGGGYRPAPHNLEAEAALLGAALLSSDAAGHLAKLTRPEDFYRPAFRTIASAICTMFENDEPVDVLTVADHLRRSRKLDDAGGRNELLGLQANAPGTSNAAHYAQIIHDHATLRRLIESGLRIGDLAYDTPSDVHAAVLHAQALVAGVAQQNGSRTFSNLDVPDMAELLAGGDVTAPEADFLRRTDGRALIYSGLVNVLQGEPSGGKTFLALFAIVEALVMGGSAAMLDYEATKTEILGRLLALGAPADAIREGRFAYVQPTGPFGQPEKLELGHLFGRLNPDVVVIDSIGEALSRDGLDEDKAKDFTTWNEKLPRWIARTGAAVIALDHVAKNTEQRGRWARGSGAKLGAVDGAAYTVKVSSSFSRHRDGVIRLGIAKDKPGGVGSIGDIAAVVIVEPRAGGERVNLRFEVDTAALHAGDAWKPTRLMAKIALTLEESTIPLSTRALKSMVRSDKPKLVDEALARLMAEGNVVEVHHGSTKVLHLVRPYEGEHATEPEIGPEPEPPPELFDADQPITDEEWKERNL